MQKAISPLDGRYARILAPLGDVFSEFALAQERCRIELRYLKALDATGVFPVLNNEELVRIDAALASFRDADFDRVKAIEADVNHDVKACELFLKEKLNLRQPEMIHFGLTSADINNLATAGLLRRFRDEHQLPQLRELLKELAELAEQWKAIPFPARTHGQPASPTTAGKEVAVFLSRLLKQTKQLASLEFTGKMNGATGTYAALAITSPDIDWPAFSKQLVESLGLEWSACTTQIEGNDTIAEHLHLTSRINSIVLDLDQDFWQYISRGEIVQKTIPGEVGSSTMPHKVNPIRFENSEGNLTIANALIPALAQKLTQSRMQRDLSGSTVQRNLGVAFAHSYLAIQQTMQGLSRIDLNADVARQHVDASPEVLAEAVQTLLRAEGVENPYELLKSLTRGSAITLESLHSWIDGLDIRNSTKEHLKALRPSDYIGLAVAITEEVIRQTRTWLTS